MLKKLIIGIALQGSTVLFAQEGVLKVHVTDSIKGEPLEMAIILLESAGIKAGIAETNEKGVAVFKNLRPGEYNVITSLSNYPKHITEKVIINNRETTNLDVMLSSIVKEAVVIMGYKKPLVQTYGTAKFIFDREQLEASPLPAMELIAQGTGAVQQKEGMAPSFHGARTTSNVVYIDGMRVIGSADLPRMGIEQISVTLSGVPAEFGDGTGGFIELETRSGLVNPKKKK